MIRLKYFTNTKFNLSNYLPIFDRNTATNSMKELDCILPLLMYLCNFQINNQDTQTI